MLTIDLAAIEANWKKLAGMTMPVECAAVVKADAYGCGLEPVTRKLAKAGCRTFFVADVAEGRRVRAIAPRRDDLCAQRTDAGHGAGVRRRQSAAGDQQHDRACRMGCLRRHQATGAAARRCTSIPA